VFGTVVAGCAILGMTYAFPFDRILEDVRTHFPGATLPGPEEPTGNGQHGMRDPMATERAQGCVDILRSQERTRAES
jgi:hypothetical protein